MLMNCIMIIISQCIHVSNHHIEYLKEIQVCLSVYLNKAAENLGG